MQPATVTRLATKIIANISEIDVSKMSAVMKKTSSNSVCGMGMKGNYQIYGWALTWAVIIPYYPALSMFPYEYEYVSLMSMTNLSVLALVNLSAKMQTNCW